MGTVAHHLGCTRVITFKISLNLSLDNRCPPAPEGGGRGGGWLLVAVEESF